MSPEKPFNRLPMASAESRPITPEDIDVSAMRQTLIEAGINLNISETERQSLAESQFRYLETGRGPGVVAVLGEEKARSLLAWCRKRCQGGPRIGGRQDTEGRGLRQLTADILQLVTTPDPSQEDLQRFCLRTNQRIKKGLQGREMGSARQAFADVPKPKDAFSSVPYGSVSELWSFLIEGK